MRARRTDANLTEIADAFRALGCSVDHTNDLWDLTIGYGGLTMLIEVKDGRKVPSARKLTKRAASFKASWKGGYRIVESVDQVSEVVSVLRQITAALRDPWQTPGGPLPCAR